MTDHDDAGSSRTGGTCPRCGTGIERVSRDATDRLLGRFRKTRRYRCVDVAGCGWTGLIERSADRTKRESRIARRVAWTLAVLAVVVGVAELARPLVTPALQAAAPRQPQRMTPLDVLPPGAHIDGTPVVFKANEKPPVTGISLRRNCVWGEPGRNPYKGSVEDALKAAKLPPEVVKQIADNIRLGMATDRIAMSRDGITTVDGRRRFDPLMHSMAFGRSACLDTVVNFKPGHVEQGPLYEALDRNGRSYTVVVPDVCGNVAVLSEYPQELLAAAAPGEVAGERAESPSGSGTGGTPDTPSGGGGGTPDTPPGGGTGRSGTPPGGGGEGVPTGDTPGGGGGGGRPPPGVPPRTPFGGGGGSCCDNQNTVPEPGTWALVGAGLLLVLATRRRRSAG